MQRNGLRSFIGVHGYSCYCISLDLGKGFYGKGIPNYRNKLFMEITFLITGHSHSPKSFIGYMLSQYFGH